MSCLLWAFLASCAPYSTEQRLESLEESAIDQKVLEARLDRVEEHLQNTDPRFVSGRPLAAPTTQDRLQAEVPYSQAATPRPVAKAVSLVDHGPALLPMGGAGAGQKDLPAPTGYGASPQSPAQVSPVKSNPSTRPQGLPAAFRTGVAAYDAALARYFQNDFAGAAQEFSAFASANPGHKLVPNALYWLGECHYSKKDFPAAILAFKNVTTQYPRHSKAAASLLKLGMAYSWMGDKENARFYWQILLEDFPKSAPAGIARSQIRQLG